MNSDARISTSFPTHPKTKKLIRRLDYAGAWCLMRLFLWVAQSRPDGDLEGYSDEDLELAVDWPGENGKLIATLAEIGFLDGDSGSRSIHDWSEHNPWAASANERIESSRWAALCKRYGRDGAAERMPDYAARMRAARERHAERMRGDDNRSATPTSTPPAPPVQVDETKPARAKAPRAKAKSCAAWDAYSGAYQARYGAMPVRNAKVNGQLARLVDRLGEDEAAQVAAYYVGHPAAWYSQRMHSVDCLLADAEKLRTEWATGRLTTAATVRHAERTASNPFARMAADLRREDNDEAKH